MFKHHVELLMKEPLQYLINLQQVSTPMPVITDPSITIYDKPNGHDNLSIDIRTIFLEYEQNNSNMNNTLLQDNNDSEMRSASS